MTTKNERAAYLIELASLSVPLLDAVERRETREIKHKENGSRIVTHEREHVDELLRA